MLTDGMSQWVLFDDLAQRYAGHTPQPTPGFRDHLASEAAYPRHRRRRTTARTGSASSAPAASRCGRTASRAAIARSRSIACGTMPGSRSRSDLSARAKEPAFSALERAAVALGRARHRDRRVPAAHQRQSRDRARTAVRESHVALRAHVRALDAAAVPAHRGARGRHVREPGADRQGRADAIDPPWPGLRQHARHRRLHAQPAAALADSASTTCMRSCTSSRLPCAAAPARAKATCATRSACRCTTSTPARSRLGFDCHAATFDGDTQARMRAQLVRVLEALASDASQPIDTLPLLDDAERRQVLNARARARAGGRRAGRGRPDRDTSPAPPAAHRGRRSGRHAHYAELDALSNRLARRLRALGVEPRLARRHRAAALHGGAGRDARHAQGRRRVRADRPVASRGARAADPGRRRARGADCAGAVPAHRVAAAATRLLPLDDLAAATADLDAGPLELACDPDQLAYILFTSGSTGRPRASRSRAARSRT